MSTQIQEKLDRYDNLLARVDVIQQDKDKALQEAIPEEIQKAIEAVNTEFDAMLGAAQASAAELKKEIAEDVKAHGETVKGEHYQAVFSRRVSWDSKAVVGYAAAHPEINEFRRESLSVAIRKR